MSDLISRQAAIDAINKAFERVFAWDGTSPLGDKVLENVPSAQPKIGKWIRFKEFENGYYHIRCSECGQYWSVDGHAKAFKYCFNCGAKMAESEGEE